MASSLSIMPSVHIPPSLIFKTWLSFCGTGIFLYSIQRNWGWVPALAYRPAEHLLSSLQPSSWRSLPRRQKRTPKQNKPKSRRWGAWMPRLGLMGGDNSWGVSREGWASIFAAFKPLGCPAFVTHQASNLLSLGIKGYLQAHPPSP